MSQTTMTSVVCTECRRENEPERVYCHDCGARLDRASIKVRTTEQVEDARKRVKKLFSPHRARIRAAFFKLSKLTLGACMTACVVLAFIPPPLPGSGKPGFLGSQIRMDLETATTRHSPPQLHYTDEQINMFLASTLKTKAAALNKPFLDFRRAVVSFQEANCNFTTERSISGLYPVYLTWSFQPNVTNGKLTAKTTGGKIGSLPIHPQLAKYMSWLFVDVSAA